MTTIDLREAIITQDRHDPDVFHYSPKAPGIAIDAEGRRQFNILTAGSVSFLQVTGCWGLNDPQIAALREELARKTGRDAAGLKLRPVPESVHGAALLLSDGAAGFTALQQSKSSGVPPYHAAFNVMLDATQLKTVQAALDGKRLQLLLRYDITQRIPVTSTSAEHVATSEARESSRRGHSCHTGSDYTETTVAHETTEEIKKLSVQLDAADWPASR